MSNGVISYLAFISIAVFQFLYISVQYYFNRRNEYLYYLAYILSLLSYSTLVHEAHIGFQFFTKFDSNALIHFDRVLGIVAYFFYYRFARHFLDLENHYPQLNNYIRKTEYAIISYVLFELGWEFIGLSRQTGEWFFIGFASSITVVTMYYIYLLIREDLLLIGFIISAVIVIHTGSLLTLVMVHTGIAENYFEAYLPMHISILIELIIFTSGLAYKSNLNEQLKVKTQKELIQQLERNFILENDLNNTQTLLAREMHDEIGSSISSIKIYTELAYNSSSDKTTPASQSILKAGKLSSQVMEYMSDMLWALHPESRSTNNLKSRVNDYIREYFVPLELRCEPLLNIKTNIRQLDPVFFKDILLMIRQYFLAASKTRNHTVHFNLELNEREAIFKINNTIVLEAIKELTASINKYHVLYDHETEICEIRIRIPIIRDGNKSY